MSTSTDYFLHRRTKEFNNPLQVKQNGYVYIYTNNESSLNVYFDNLKVKHHRGPLLEETHYYPFGLTMAGISSKAANRLENKLKFNSGSELENKEFSDGSGLEWYATDFRKYDHQIGRFTGIDLLGELNFHNSGYVFGSNNPIFFNDPSGLLDSVGTNQSGETIYHNTGDNLQNVTITPTSHARNNPSTVNWLGWPSYGGKTGRQLQNETNTQLSRRDQGLHYLPYGDTSYYNRSWQADQDWRKRSIAAVGILASPLILEIGIVAGTDALLWKMGLDGLGQTVVNGGDISKLDIWDMTLAGVSAPGASALFGGAVDIRLNGEVNLVGYTKSWQTAGLDGVFKFAFGGNGIGGIPGNMLRKVTFSTPLTKFESVIFLRCLSVPINMSGKVLRNAVKQNTGL